MTKRVLILGGYGNFGSYITKKLAGEKDIQLIIGGRSAEKALAFAAQYSAAPNPPIGMAMDIHQNLLETLHSIKPDIVIHTCGPFQHQGYDVAEACIMQGCHYIDLADGREFVSGITALGARAKEKNVIIISGASSVPCLTSAIIQHYQDKFKKITEVDYAISTAQRTNTGLATTEAVLSYAGKPFQTLVNGAMRPVYGWQNMKAHWYPELGLRLHGNCDIPDLTLFPKYFLDLQTIRFRAGLEIPFMHLGLWLLTWFVRFKLINSLAKHASLLLSTSRLFDGFGSDRSGFYMKLKGFDTNGQKKEETFTLIAKSGHGPFIPATPAILLAKHLTRGQFNRSGAFPCIGLLSLDDYFEGLSGLDIERFQ